jgi:hypothetical protein
VRLKTSPPLLAECHEICELKPPGTLWVTPGLLRDSFTFLITHIGRVIRYTVRLYVNDTFQLDEVGINGFSSAIV